jgi:hypothetical protein
MRYVDDRRVVTVGIDSSVSAGAAVDWSLEYARSHGSAVRLIAAVSRDRSGSAEEARAMVDNLALLAQSTVPGLEVTGELASDSLGPALLEAAQDSTLVVIGDRAPRRRVSDLRPVVDALVAWAECPVVVARSARWPNPAAPVVAALDGSDHDDAVLSTAFDLAARCASPLVAVHLAVGGPDRVAAARVATRLAHRERDYAKVPVRFRAAVGPAAPVLLTAARWASLLVVGPSDPDGVLRAVIHAAACPVLVVRPWGVPAGALGIGEVAASVPV